MSQAIPRSGVPEEDFATIRHRIRSIFGGSIGNVGPPYGVGIA